MPIETRTGAQHGEPIRTSAESPISPPPVTVVDGRFPSTPRSRPRWVEVPGRVLIALDEGEPGNPSSLRFEFFDGEQRTWRLRDRASEGLRGLARALARKVKETGGVHRW